MFATVNRLAFKTSKQALRSQNAFSNMMLTRPATRIFSNNNAPTLDSAPGFADVSDVLKVNYTEEFD